MAADENKQVILTPQGLAPNFILDSHKIQQQYNRFGVYF